MDLVGTVHPLALLTAPPSGAACILYRVRLSLLQRLVEGPGTGSSREVAGVPFMLACRLGEVLVRCARAALRLEPPRRHRVRVGEAAEQDARLAELYFRLCRPQPIQGQRIACLEQRINPGERVWVAGTMRREPDVGGAPAGYRLPPSRLILEARELATLP